MTHSDLADGCARYSSVGVQGNKMAARQGGMMILAPGQAELRVRLVTTQLK